jgi:hypothetical protein
VAALPSGVATSRSGGSRSCVVCAGVDALPSDETPAAAGLLAELDWLAGEIAREQADEDALRRPASVAHVLFTALDDPGALPVLRRFLAAGGIDLDAILGCLQPGAPVTPRSERLAVVDRARERLRPFVAAAVKQLPAQEQSGIQAAADRRCASFSEEAFRRRRA